MPQRDFLMKGMSTKISHHGAIILLILANLIIGLLVFRDYGDSFDEGKRRVYANLSLQAYQRWIDPSFEPVFGSKESKYHGPSFIMGAELATRFLHSLAPSIPVTQFWHLLYFLCFQAAALCLYLLCLRWMSRWAAFGTTLLFTTQPLLWGHAFINPKDIPFLTFFLASILTGIRMSGRKADSTVALMPPIKAMSAFLAEVLHRWRGLSPRAMKVIIWVNLLILASILFLNLGSGLVDRMVGYLVSVGFTADPSSLLGKLMANLANRIDQVPLSNYIRLAQTRTRSLIQIYSICSGMLLLGIDLFALNVRIHLPGKGSTLSFFRDLAKAFIKPEVWLAGVVLGLASSIRILGPLAGVIVSGFVIWRHGKRSATLILAYGCISLLVMFLTWPILWSAPISNLLITIKTMADFPWVGTVLFNGQYYRSDALPISYVPVLLSIQLTEVMLPLFFFGLLLILSKPSIQIHQEILVLLLSWFVLPAGYLILTRATMYDNFRHLLFILPPVFILGGLALEKLYHLVKRVWLKTILLILLILPGISACISLHPYQYIYCNLFVGGNQGAYQRFEVDYWMTSFREAAEYLNTHASPYSRVVVWGGKHLISGIVREDMLIEGDKGNTYSLEGGYQYAILSSRWGQNDIYPDAHIVFSVERNGALLVVVKELQPGDTP